jgi:hypothetical protein
MPVGHDDLSVAAVARRAGALRRCRSARWPSLPADQAAAVATPALRSRTPGCRPRPGPEASRMSSLRPPGPSSDIIMSQRGAAWHGPQQAGAGGRPGGKPRRSPGGAERSRCPRQRRHRHAAGGALRFQSIALAVEREKTDSCRDSLETIHLHQVLDTAGVPSDTSATPGQARTGRINLGLIILLYPFARKVAPDAICGKGRERNDIGATHSH